jgi:hypothetical protein
MFEVIQKTRVWPRLIPPRLLKAGSCLSTMILFVAHDVTINQKIPPIKKTSRANDDKVKLVNLSRSLLEAQPISQLTVALLQAIDERILVKPKVSLSGIFDNTQIVPFQNVDFLL